MVFALFSLAVFGWLKPLTYYAYRSVMFDVKNVEVFYLAEEGVFMQSGGRTFILDKLNRDTREFEHIFLFDYNGRGENETLTAANGKLVPVPGQPRPVLRLNDGHRLKLESWPLAAKAGEIPMASVGEFEQTDTPLGKLKQDIFRPRGNDERELTLPELYAQLDTPPKGATKNSMAAEFHKRLVNIIGMLVLPFLALPFALGRARSQHGYRIGIAMVLIIAFHEIIEQGAVAVEASGVSPWLALWLPLGALAAFSFWRFFVSSFRLRQEVLEGILDGINNSVRGLWQRLRGKAEATP
jgi:lipopolysaccharide export system permease protein